MQERRKWQTDLAVWRLDHRDNHRPGGVMTRMPGVQGRPTANPDLWGSALQAHCSEKYGVQDGEEQQRELLQQLDDEVADRPSPSLVRT